MFDYATTNYCNYCNVYTKLSNSINPNQGVKPSFQLCSEQVVTAANQIYTVFCQQRLQKEGKVNHTAGGAGSEIRRYNVTSVL